MQIVPEFTFHVGVGAGFRIGGGPFGDRMVGVVDGGWVRGERITGQVVGPGADWAVKGADGFAHIDVRAQVRTDDGAYIYLHYTGSLDMNEAITTALSGDGETQFGDAYWAVHVRLESGAAQYRWVNRTIFVGEGRVATDGVEYEISRVV